MKFLLFEIQKSGYWIIWWLHMCFIGYFFYFDLTLSELNLVVLFFLALPYGILFLYARYIGTEYRLMGSYRGNLFHNSGSKGFHRLSYGVYSFLVASSLVNVMPALINTVGNPFLALMGLFISVFLFFEFTHFKVIKMITQNSKLVEVPLTDEEIQEENRKRREREEREIYNKRVAGDPECRHDWHEYSLGYTEKRRCKNCSRIEFKFNYRWVLNDR